MNRLVILMIGLMATQLTAQEGADVIVRHYAARNFLAGDVGKEKLDAVLAAGVNAPSAMNRQPWLFTVVQSERLLKQIMPDAKAGNALIIVSTRSAGDASAVLDCGLAVQSMYLAAQAVGLGSRIYTGPMGTINARFKGELPAGYTAVALVRIGLVEAVDAVTAASSRKAVDQVVTYK
jgi:nitroreductase